MYININDSTHRNEFGFAHVMMCDVGRVYQRVVGDATAAAAGVAVMDGVFLWRADENE